MKPAKLNNYYQNRPGNLITVLPDGKAVNLKGTPVKVPAQSTANMPKELQKDRVIPGATQQELNMLASMDEWKYLFDFDDLKPSNTEANER